MAVLGHNHVSDNSETHFLAQIAEGLDELEFKTVGVKDASAPINVGGQVVKMVVTVIVRPSRCHAPSLS
jgi:hypothetical protein